MVSAIGGTGGIGKTYLALHWAHHHAGRFPDGQLYVNLRGFDPADRPLAPAVVIRGFLDALGVEADTLPAEPDAQAGLFRSLVAGRRILIVLDNARETAQIVPLLPGSPTCTVLVTSRHRLTGLVATHGAKPLPLDALPEAEARELLARHMGEDRLAAEPQAVTALLEHCAGLPLALSIIAARAAAQPDFPLAHLAEELAEADTRLDALDTGDLSADLRAVFAASHRILPDEAAQALALLGLAPGPDIGLHAAASLTAAPIPRTRVLLRTLESAHLVQQHTPGRYQMHDLVRLYAAEHGQALPRPEREAALRRLVDCYLHTAHHAGLLLESPPVPAEPDPPAVGCIPQRLADGKAALAWYDTERPHLLAAQRLAADLGWPAPVWQLPHALYALYGHRGHAHDALVLWQTALAAADRLADPAPKALAHCYLGHAQGFNRQPEALENLGRALALFEQTGNLPGQAAAHQWHAGRLSAQGDPRRALPHAERARQLHRSLGNTAREAMALDIMGDCRAFLGEYAQARACYEEALALARAAGDHHVEAGTLDDLGDLARDTGEHAQALDWYHQALALFRDDGGTYWEAGTLSRLGQAHRALGQIAEARQAWQHARDLYRAQRHTVDAERLQQQLDTLDGAQGE